MDRRALGRASRDRRGRRRRRPCVGFALAVARTGRGRRTRRRSRTRSTSHRDRRGAGIGELLLARARRPRPRPRLPLGRSRASSAATTRRSRCTRACGFEQVGVEREVGRKFGKLARRRADAEDAVTTRTVARPLGDAAPIAAQPPHSKEARKGSPRQPWAGLDSNQRSVTQRVYSPSPLATRVPTRIYDSSAFRPVSEGEQRRCRASTSSPRSTCKRCATPSTRRAASSRRASTSRAPTARSS